MESDLELLPPDLAARSASNREIVLRYEDALRALEHLRGVGVRVLGWEGWLVYPDGRTSHSRRFQGTADLTASAPEKAIEISRATITGAHIMSSAGPEDPDAELHFCISVAAP